VLRCACAVAGQQTVDVRHLDLAACGAPGHATAPGQPSSADLTLEATERRAIVDALQAHGGNVSRAAATLGIHRTTLRRKLTELGLTRRKPR
jgi:DNA-binding NtrC family response regulator